MVVVLALEPDRVSQALLFGSVRTVFKDFTPGFVVCAPDDLAVLVGHFMRGAVVVAVVLTAQQVARRIEGEDGAAVVIWLFRGHRRREANASDASLLKSGGLRGQKWTDAREPLAIRLAPQAVFMPSSVTGTPLTE